MSSERLGRAATPQIGPGDAGGKAGVCPTPMLGHTRSSESAFAAPPSPGIPNESNRSDFALVPLRWEQGGTSAQVMEATGCDCAPPRGVGVVFLSGLVRRVILPRRAG